MIDRFRAWYEYERDSHTKVLAELQSVPADRRGEPECRKAVSIFAHLIVCRRLWLHRLGMLDEGPHDLFPKEVSLETLAAWQREVDELWTRRLGEWTDADLATPFEYAAFEGKRYRNTIEEILTQLFGHSWYHRGQIAMLVKQSGGKPVETDFVYFSRRPCSD